MLITLPYKVLVEKSVEGKVAATLESLGFGKACTVFCSSHIQKIVGSKIFSELSSNFDLTIVEPDKVMKKQKVNGFVLGIGGGRSIDTAKYAAHLAGKPWVAFPTILSHDGVVSSRAVLEENGSKISVDAEEPSAIIADLGIIGKADYSYLASGLGDLISNFSAVEDWKIADRAGKEKYHEMMARLSLISAEAALKHAGDIRKKNEHSLEVLFWSLVSSGFAMNIYGSSRPCSGSEHNISHALDKLGSTALHGRQVALCTIISTYLQKGDWQKIRSSLQAAELPTNCEELGVDREKMIEALAMAKDIRNRYTVLNLVDLTKQSAEKVLKAVEII
jgi:glycerol-1-phosphate dehydrogenase [NAD(P)+]